MTELVRQTTDGQIRVMLTDSGRYEVWNGDECIARTTLRTVADDEFADARNARSELSQEKRARERSHFDMQAMRSESFERRAAGARKSGGPGGRGGV